VAVSDNKAERFSFQAVVIETLANHAAALREKFYLLNPELLHQALPYLAPYPFIPFLPSKEWTILKISHLARLHMKLISEQRPIFVQNLQDLCNVIFPNGATLMQNTGNTTTKVVLVPKENESEALTQLSVIQSILFNKADPEYHHKVFVEG
jgi:hypothetical protein